MRFSIFSAAILCTATPASAFTLTATFTVVATGGQLYQEFYGRPGSRTDEVAGTTFNINVHAFTGRGDPAYFDPEKIVGSFYAEPTNAEPELSLSAYGSHIYLDPSDSDTVTLTDSLFTYTMNGWTQYDNSWGSITLIADRSGTVLSNWRGSFVASRPLRWSPPTAPDYYEYRNVTFVATSANVRINNLAGVPEPDTWAMMIAGFGAVGAAARRRPGLAVEVHRV